MLVALPFVLISLVLAAVAGSHVRRHRSPCRPAHPDASPTDGQPVPVAIRVGRVGKALSAPRRGMALVAPPDLPGNAVVVFDTFGRQQRSVELSSVAMARAWSDGEPVLAFGTMRDRYGTFFAVGRNLAGWELHLVTYSGETIRCYGSPGTSLDADLSRLQDSLRRGRLLRAS